MEIIRTWKELSKLTGHSVGALVMAHKRGRLPIAARWDEGRRIFDRKEVEAWINQNRSKSN